MVKNSHGDFLPKSKIASRTGPPSLSKESCQGPTAETLISSQALLHGVAGFPSFQSFDDGQGEIHDGAGGA